MTTIERRLPGSILTKTNNHIFWRIDKNGMKAPQVYRDGITLGFDRNPFLGLGEFENLTDDMIKFVINTYEIAYSNGCIDGKASEKLRIKDILGL